MVFMGFLVESLLSLFILTFLFSFYKFPQLLLRSDLKCLSNAFKESKYFLQLFLLYLNSLELKCNYHSQSPPPPPPSLAHVPLHPPHLPQPSLVLELQPQYPPLPLLHPYIFFLLFSPTGYFRMCYFLIIFNILPPIPYYHELLVSEELTEHLYCVEGL